MLATAFILPAALFVGGIFTALWVYCIVRGGKIDRENAALLAQGASSRPPATQLHYTEHCNTPLEQEHECPPSKPSSLLSPTASHAG